MAHYDSMRDYDNKKEMVVVRFIIPISISLFNKINKLKYNVDKDIIELGVDNLDVVIGKECKLIKGKPNRQQKSCLVQIKKYYDSWEEFL